MQPLSAHMEKKKNCKNSIAAGIQDTLSNASCQNTSVFIMDECQLVKQSCATWATVF